MFDAETEVSGYWWSSSSTDAGTWSTSEDGSMTKFAVLTGEWMDPDGQPGTWTIDGD